LFEIFIDTSVFLEWLPLNPAFRDFGDVCDANIANRQIVLIVDSKKKKEHE